MQPLQIADVRTHTAATPIPFRELTQVARAGLAERLGVDSDAVNVRGVQSTTFRNESLGLAERGVSYSPRPVRGWFVKLSSGQDDFEARGTYADPQSVKYAAISPEDASNGAAFRWTRDERGILVRCADT